MSFEVAHDDDGNFTIMNNEFNQEADINISESACIFNRPAFRFGASIGFFGKPAARQGVLLTAGRVHQIAPNANPAFILSLFARAGIKEAGKSQIGFEYGMRFLQKAQ